MSAAPETCPFCASPLDGHAELRDRATHVTALACPRCGRYSYDDEARALVDAADARTRRRMAHFLAFLARTRGDRPLRLTRAHLLGDPSAASGPADAP